MTAFRKPEVLECVENCRQYSKKETLVADGIRLSSSDCKAEQQNFLLPQYPDQLERNRHAITIPAA